MNNTYAARAEAVYIGYFIVDCDKYEDAWNIATQIKEETEFPNELGEKVKFYWDSINIDDIEPCGEGKFNVSITIVYHAFMTLEAEDCIVASSIADKRVEDEKVPDFFGDFKLDMKYVYDLAMLPPEVY